MADPGYDPPRDPLEIWLARKWQDVLGFTVGIREGFFGIGGNSLDAARVIDAILTEFGIQLPLNVLTEHPTVESLAALLRAQAGPDGLSGSSPGPLIAIQDGDGGHPPLFLIHPDNGQASPYCRLASALGEEYAVYGIQAAGLHSGAEPARTVPDLAAGYLGPIRAACPDGPYLLGGSGVGAAVACELAARISGEQPGGEQPGEVRLVAVIGAGLLEPLPGDPPDMPAGYAGRASRVRRACQDAARGWKPSSYPGPVDVFGQQDPPGQPELVLPATASQRPHPCGTGEELAGALRELIG